MGSVFDRLSDIVFGTYKMPGGEGRDGCCVLGRVMSLSDMVLGFFENGEGSPESYPDGGGDSGDIEIGSSDEGSDGFGSSVGAEERKAFWESQHQVLQVQSDET